MQQILYLSSQRWIDAVLGGPTPYLLNYCGHLCCYKTFIVQINAVILNFLVIWIILIIKSIINRVAHLLTLWYCTVYVQNRSIDPYISKADQNEHQHKCPCASVHIISMWLCFGPEWMTAEAHILPQVSDQTVTSSLMLKNKPLFSQKRQILDRFSSMSLCY